MDFDESIQFYQSIARSKDDLVKSESKRAELEREFHRSFKSDRKLVQVRAQKLQEYYKRLCENERVATLRNQQMLGDMARAENRLQHLESKLERLSALKKECQNYIQSNYPQWQSLMTQIIVDDKQPPLPQQLTIDTSTPHVTLNNKIVNLLSKQTSPSPRPNGDSLMFNDNLVEEYKQELQKAENPNNSIVGDLLSGAFNRQKQTPSWTRTNEVRNFDEKYKQSQNESDSSSHDDHFKRKNSSLRKELSINALYHLLEYIEADMNNTIHKDKYYRTEQPHYKEKLEIIKLASELKPLDDIDSGNVSMVVLSQLKSVIAKHTQNGCLFTDEILSFSVTDMNEQVVYSHLRDESDRHLWKKLVTHWCCLKRFGASDASTLATLFAPCLIKHESYGELKAKQFIQKIINTSSLIMDEPEHDVKTPRTDTSFNDMLLGPTPHLAESNSYKDFIKKSSLIKKLSDDDDEDDDELMDEQLLPIKQSTSKQEFVLSPRRGDLSQSSLSEQKSEKGNKLFFNSQKLNKTPTYLKRFDDLDSDEDSKSQSQKQSNILSRAKSTASDADFDFYN